jgi:hypothetical protein
MKRELEDEYVCVLFFSLNTLWPSFVLYFFSETSHFPSLSARVCTVTFIYKVRRGALDQLC